MLPTTAVKTPLMVSAMSRVPPVKGSVTAVSPNNSLPPPRNWVRGIQWALAPVLLKLAVLVTKMAPVAASGAFGFFSRLSVGLVIGLPMWANIELGVVVVLLSCAGSVVAVRTRPPSALLLFRVNECRSLIVVMSTRIKASLPTPPM